MKKNNNTKVTKIEIFLFCKMKYEIDEKVNVVGKGLVWWYWDNAANRLYIINLKSKNNITRFTAYQFPETSFVAVLAMTIPSLPHLSGIFYLLIFIYLLFISIYIFYFRCIFSKYLTI